MRLPWQKEQSGGGMILPRGWKRNIARQRVFAACSPTSSARILSPPGAVSLSSRARSSRTGGRAGKDEQAQTARPRNAQAAARRASPWPPPAPSGRPSPAPAAGARGTRRHARPAVDAGRCRWCLANDGVIEPPDNEDRRWWLERFSDEEIAEAALFMFGRRPDRERIRRARERLLGVMVAE
jgi:hypothetical protein